MMFKMFNYLPAKREKTAGGIALTADRFNHLY
jgi:hypothetical protein